MTCRTKSQPSFDFENQMQDGQWHPVFATSRQRCRSMLVEQQRLTMQSHRLSRMLFPVIE